VSLTKVALASLRGGDKAKALTFFSEALPIVQKLAKVLPDDQRVKTELDLIQQQIAALRQ
jgi:hypothetical protein